MLTDAQWTVLEPLVEACRPHAKVPPSDLRRTVEAILWRCTNGAKWRAIPEELGPWWKAAQIFIRWARLGVWDRLLDLARERGVELGMAFLDGTSIRAHAKAAGASKRILWGDGRLSIGRLGSGHLDQEAPMASAATPVSPAETASATLFVALELSRSTWLVALHSPLTNKVSQHRLDGGDADGLLALIARKRGQAEEKLGQPVRVVCCFEAGYDGFWLHRWLCARGIENRVLDAASLLVNRRARRV